MPFNALHKDAQLGPHRACRINSVRRPGAMRNLVIGLIRSGFSRDDRSEISFFLPPSDDVLQ
jgi:hypothetical protein